MGEFDQFGHKHPEADTRPEDEQSEKITRQQHRFMNWLRQQFRSGHPVSIDEAIQAEDSTPVALFEESLLQQAESAKIIPFPSRNQPPDRPAS